MNQAKSLGHSVIVMEPNCNHRQVPVIRMSYLHTERTSDSVIGQNFKFFCCFLKSESYPRFVSLSDNKAANDHKSHWFTKNLNYLSICI